MADYGEGTGILAIKDGADTFSAQRNYESQRRRGTAPGTKPQPDPKMKNLAAALKKRKAEKGMKP